MLRDRRSALPWTSRARELHNKSIGSWMAIHTMQSNVKKDSEASSSITIGERCNGGLSFGTLRGLEKLEITPT